MVVCGDITVVSVVEYFIYRAKQVYPRLQFLLRLVGLCFCGHESNVFPFRGHIMSIGAAEEVPATILET